MEDKKIRICAITTISKTLDWFMVDSMRNLSKNGYEVTFISNMEQGFVERVSDFAKCIHLPMARGASIKDLFKSTREMKKIFKKEKFDVLYYATPNASMYASAAGKKAKIKTRIYNQWGIRYVALSGIKRVIFKFIEKMTCRKSTCIKAQSPMNMEFAIKEGLCKRDKISVVGIGGTIGVDLSQCDNFNHQEAKEQLRNKYEIKKGAFVYGYVGRINKDKGINELIEAFDTIKAKNDNAYLVLVGMKDDANPISAENMQKAESDERIILTGNVAKEEVYKYMAMFDVLVHPTYREGFGKVLQEAMGMSLPIITTNIVGPSEVVDQGKYGLLAEVKSSSDLAEKMQAIKDDDELRQKFAVLGRERAEKYFDRPIMLNNILVDINKITGEQNAF